MGEILRSVAENGHVDAPPDACSSADRGSPPVMSVEERQREARGATKVGNRQDPSEAAPALGHPTPVARDDWRAKIRSKPGIGQLYRAAVFVVGLLFVLAGVALAALPGPLTIPPVLLGLYIWSTEFRWARKLFKSFHRKGKQAWAHAKAHPVSSAAITIGGLLLAGAAFWAVGHFELIDKAKDLIGL